MLILLTIFLLLFVSLAMLILYLARPKFSIQGFLAVLGVLVGWLMVLLARSDVSRVITLLNWEPGNLFSVSPSLLIDDISWYFSLALISLSLSLIITSIAQLGQTLKPEQNKITPKIEVAEVQGLSEAEVSPATPVTAESHSLPTNWQSWAGILVLTSLGLVAVTAGNLLTLLLAWAAVDVIELVILLGQVIESESRQRIILAFTARMAGIGSVLLAGIIPWSQGISLSFDAITQSTSIYLLIAAGLRLGVLPLHLLILHDLPLRRGLGTVLRLVPAAASYILLVRVAKMGVLGAATPYLLGLSALAGLYAAINWVSARDELDGRPYWLLGTASLAVASAILNRPMACLAWSMASILSGGLIFSASIRHKNLIPIFFLGLFNLSAMPFSATWLGTDLYRYPTLSAEVLPSSLFYLLSFVFLLVHAFLLAGFIRHALRGFLPSSEQSAGHVERWVWFLYPIGLIFITVTHLLIGILMRPNINEIPLSAWIMGAVAVIFSLLIWYIPWHFPQAFSRKEQPLSTSPLTHLFSMEWLYRLLWRLFRLLARLIALLSTVLEGDGGILWALVLFALIFVFLQR